jgi:hypothetical protein
MAQIQGKQLADNTISTAKIAPNAVTSAKVDSSVLVAAGTNPLTADWNVNNFKITGLVDPSNPSDAATKNYVDAIAQGLDVKQSMRVATTGPLPSNTRSGNVLTATANGALAAQDGITLALNDRILVKDEATGANNGLYFVSQVGNAGAPFTLTRTTDADTSAKVTAGLFVFIEEGATNGDSGWVLSTDNPITLNTTALTFAQFSGGGTVTAGNGLTKTGSTIDVVIAAGSAGLSANPNDISINYTLAGGLTAIDAAAASAGTAETIPRGDHKHSVTTAAAGTIAVGDASAAGSATSLARSDHTHALPAPAAPADVTKSAASAGAATTVARADHKHDVSTAAPAAGAVAAGNTAAEGTATSLARSDHQHAVSVAAPVDVGSANAAGAATTFVRSDHVHRVPRQVTANKSLTASVTTSDGDQATATTVASANALGGYVGVRVNGVHYLVGDGTKVSVDCYFSGDGGTTARAMSAIVAGDTLRWNGSVAGFQLAATDRIDFLYESF